MKRAALFLLVAAVLLAAHVAYWYLPRERAVVPMLEGLPAAARATGTTGTAGETGAAPGNEPLQVLAAGGYDVCVWVPYPHQNLGVLASAVGDLPDVVAAVGRLTAGEMNDKAREAAPPPTFGPLEVPPADELTICTDLERTPPGEAAVAAGDRGVRRLKVVARIYPALSVVAKLAGRLAGNPWLAGGTAGRASIAWDGRLWTITEGPEARPAPLDDASPPPAADGPSPRRPVAGAATAAGVAGAADAASAPSPPSPLPASLALVHWAGARPEIPAGYYALTRDGADLTLALLGASASPAASPPVPAGEGSAPALLVVAGPEWRSGGVLGLRGASGTAATAPPLAPAALALFESGGSRLSSLGDLPGLAVFNAAGAPGKERWDLPAAGIARLMAGRLPSADRAGWHILALDRGSLRQAESLAPALSSLVAPGAEGAVGSPGGPPAAAGSPASSPASPPLSLGVWLEPPVALHMVTRIHKFIADFPLASRRQVDLWRDWQTVLEPFAHCRHATLTATASPASMRLRLAACTVTQP